MYKLAMVTQVLIFMKWILHFIGGKDIHAEVALLLN